MGLLDALKAATADVQSEPKKKETPQPSAIKHQTSNKAKPAAKATTKTDTPKQKGGAKYVIPAEFKQAIEDYLKGRADMADKLNAKGKSIDGCCDYIFEKMLRRAEKERNGKNAVGFYVNPDEVFGMAVHYYDEPDEDLKEELKKK